MRRKSTGSESGAQLGRRSAALAEVIRQSIAAGEVGEGRFLSSEREFAALHGVNKKTVRRALKALEDEGLVQAVERHGYRVAMGMDAQERGSPIAYIPWEKSDISQWTIPANLLLPALQEAANRRGHSLLAVGSIDRTSKAILAEIRRLCVSGIVIDSDDPELLREVQESGITTVMVDQWVENTFADSVMQNGLLGGMQAVRYLRERGCRRVGWFGSSTEGIHRIDRYSGFAAGVCAAGLPLRGEDIISVPEGRNEATAMELLRRRDRPDGIFAPWNSQAKALLAAARALDLKPGRDLHVVGWSPEEALGGFYQSQFAPRAAPPAITWSAQVMAEVAMTRLMERRRNPQFPPMRLLIPTRLALVE
jgi:DNA-binding LacI/PurR family transcriptional regulator